MNPTKKPPGLILPPVIQRLNQVSKFKPVVAQLKTAMPAQNAKRPVAPPVYRPQQTVPRVLQTKSAQPRPATQTSRQPVAPPVYRPEVKKIVQPKALSASPLRVHTVMGAPAHKSSAPVKLTSAIQPVTVKRTAYSFSAVQMAKKEKKARKACYATVVKDTGERYDGIYKKVHAEIDALEQYLGSGGALADIASIDLSSAPCKYCHFILKDLGIRGKVVTPDKRPFGSCQGGSYGFFSEEGAVWAAIKATGEADFDVYLTSVIDRKNAVK